MPSRIIVVVGGTELLQQLRGIFAQTMLAPPVVAPPVVECIEPSMCCRIFALSQPQDEVGESKSLPCCGPQKHTPSEGHSLLTKDQRCMIGA